MLKMKNDWKILVFLLPNLFGVTIFVLLPFGDVILRSFQVAVTREWSGLKNYIAMMETPAFRLAAGNTIRFEMICIPILLILSLLIAAFLHNRGQYGRVLKSVFLAPMAIPVASVVLIWRVLFDQYGIVNRIMSSAGAPIKDWMNTSAAFWILVFSYIWKNLGYDIVLWMAGLNGIPEHLYEAARVDGAGRLQCFIRITLPNLMPTLYTISVLSFLNSCKVFREGYLVAGDYPHKSMYLLQNLFNNWFREMDFDKLSAAAVCMTILIFFLVLLLKKVWDREEL